MITLTTEQAQQIEEALVEYRDTQMIKAPRKALSIIRAARAQEQAEQEPVARVTGYYGGRCVIEPLNRATVLPTDMALYAAPVQQVTRADLKAAFKEGFERAADLYAPKAEQEPSISDGLCGGCAKKSADGWALYCIECWEKGNGQFASNEPAANAHVSNADSDILSDVQQEPFAYEVWDENDQVLILIYASYLKEAPWLEEDDIIRKLYAAPVEPVKQEPVACERCEELAADKGTWYRMADMFAHRNEELKKVLGRSLNLIEGEWPEGDEVAQPVIDAMKTALANQPAPVRTKDLTDDEIMDLVRDECVDMRWPSTPLFIARAVIAADREKNRG